MVKYKAIICDVDGTLISSRYGLPSERVTDAIHKSQEKGIHVSIATARGLFELNHILKKLQLTSPCIITGGAIIIDPVTLKILKENLLSKKDVEEIRKIGERLKVPLLVEDNDKSLPLDSAYKYNKPANIYTESINASVGEIFLKEVSKISSVYPHKAVSYIKDEIYALINNSSASKQEGVLEISRMLKIKPEEIIGIGDSHNDFPLLMACGLKVAMGNAPDDLKAIADYIAPSVEKDGVADVIEKYLL